VQETRLAAEDHVTNRNDIPGYLRFLKGVGRAALSVGYSTLPLVLAIPFVLFVYLKATNAPPDPEAATSSWGGLPFNYVSLEWLAIFSSVASLGAIGSTVSFFGRHRLGKEQIQKHRTLVRTQLFGAVFAGVLLFTFVGGLVQGSLFPAFGEADSWIALAFRIPSWSKLLVWSFIAGFSERFVPDLLDNFVLRASKGEESSDGR
jgi:hypothetical protein